MGREIKFRGKSENTGEWLYGIPLKSVNGNMYFIHSATEDAINTFNDVDFVYSEVIPETVGQFTGLKDKNGVEIYEGDIVIFSKLSTVIKYFDKYGMFGLVGKSQYRKYDENEPMGSGGSSTSYKPYVLSEYYQKRIEVIGNIHDKAQQKQALIDMMRGDEEIGLYNDNPKNH